MIIFRPKEELQPRMDAIRADFARRYNLDELREQLYRMQEGLCHICEKPIQSPDSVCSEVDHAIPVRLYATWNYPIKEACGHANSFCNLVLVHSSCNRIKSSRDIEEFFEAIVEGKISFDEPLLLTQEQLMNKKRIQQENARKAALAFVAGLTPEKMQERRERIQKLNASMTSEQRSERSRKAGLAASASMTPEQKQERARKATASMTPEQRSERARKGARKGGLAYVAKTTPEQRQERSRKINCSRWNINRNKPCTCGKHVAA